MFKGASFTAFLIGGLLSVCLLVKVLEWRAFHSIQTDFEAAGGSAKKTFRGLRAGSSSSAGGAARNESAGGELATKAVDGIAGGELTTKEATASPRTFAPLPAFPTPPEVRSPKCVRHKYDLGALPRASLVIPYLKETWGHMSKTTASMLAFTPMELIDEILFVDDGNDPEWQFHKELTSLHPKVKVHRNEERQGLIKAKVTGAALIKSEVIIFMEPHCIVSHGWVEAMLERLATARPQNNLLVMPILDIIPEENFAEYRVANHHIGGFDWSMTFNWMDLIEKRNRTYRYPDPYPTPALSGGIFAMWRDYWERMGTYDTNMTEWGGEHIEMSLRMWRCGGRIEVVPCSRMGHVFRARNPYVVHSQEVVRNQNRAALVWLDEYLEKYYKEVPYAKNVNAGDVTERLLLKERLHCKSMDWYIDNIYPELRKKQPRRR